MLKQTGTYISTIPGIEDTLGFIILSEIDDINRFDASNKLVAFTGTGLDMRVTQLGEFTETKNNITKRGSPYLRRAICLLQNELLSATRSSSLITNSYLD